MPFFSSHPRLGGWRRHPRLSFPSVSPLQPDPPTSPLGFLLQDMELFLPHPRWGRTPHIPAVPVRNWYFFGVTWAGGSKCHTSLLWLRASPQLVFQCVQKGFGDPNCPELLLFNGMLKKHMPYLCFYLVNGFKRRSNDAQTTLATSL